MKRVRAEPLIFALVTLLNLVPFVSVNFFPSLDGASHLLNANLINRILFSHQDLYREFFSINPIPVPNWSSHFILAVLHLFFPAFITEKILITALLTGLPLIFRRLVRHLSPRNMLFSYLIFPFSHSLFLFFGFFNFCIASILLLVTLEQWLRHDGERLTATSFVRLSILLLLTYFSHILVFGALLLILGILALTGTRAFRQNRERGNGPIIKAAAIRLLYVAGIAAVPLMLSLWFFLSRQSAQNTTSFPFKEVLACLTDIRPLIVFDQPAERRYTIILMILLVALLLLSGVLRVFRKRDYPTTGPGFLWIPLSALALLVLCFLIPNTYGTASFTTLRLIYLVFLLVSLWIPTLPLPRGSGIAAMAVSLYVNFSLLLNYNPAIRKYSEIASSCNEASVFIEPNSLVLPLNFSENWFTSHFLDYAAIDKPVLLVYNYEAETGYFPVIRNESGRPGFFVGDEDTPSNFQPFRIRKDRPAYRVRYILILGTLTKRDDEFIARLPRLLKEEFTVAYQTPVCTLYRSR
jgi:hypothetical protein